MPWHCSIEYEQRTLYGRRTKFCRMFLQVSKRSKLHICGEARLSGFFLLMERLVEIDSPTNSDTYTKVPTNVAAGLLAQCLVFGA